MEALARLLKNTGNGKLLWHGARGDKQLIKTLSIPSSKAIFDS